MTPMERQEDILNLVVDICRAEYKFDGFLEVMDYFKKLINLCKQMNYADSRVRSSKTINARFVRWWRKGNN